MSTSDPTTFTVDGPAGREVYRYLPHPTIEDLVGIQMRAVAAEIVTGETYFTPLDVSVRRQMTRTETR